MIPSTSFILFATVVLNAVSGMGAPIKITRALAEAHQPGRRHPQPIAADDNVTKASKRAPKEDPRPYIPRRFPRRIHYEQYVREVAELASREPAPEPEVAEPVVERAAVKAEDAPHRRHSRRSRKEARSPPSTKNLAQRRNSKVGGTIAKRSTPEVKVEARSETKVEAPAKRTTVKVVAKKRSAKARVPAKKRSLKPKAPAKKRSTKAEAPAKKRDHTEPDTKRSVTKAESIVAKKRSPRSSKKVVKRTPAGSSLTKKSKRATVNAKKRSTKAKNVKRNDKKNRNLKKRSPAAATTPNKVQLRALDVPSEHLEARHYKIIKLKSHGGCGHKKPDPPVSTCGSCCCSCGCGQQQAGAPADGVPLPGIPAPGNSTVTTPPIIADPASPGSPPPVTSPAANLPVNGANTPPSGAPSPSASGMPDPKVGTPAAKTPVVPPVGRRQVKVLKQRSPRISPAKTQRRSSRNLRK